MTNSTIIRVKRRLEDNPQDALVLLCKRKKTDIEEVSPSLFVFQGTVVNQEIAYVKNIVPKTDPKAVHSVEDILNKIRKEKKEKETESRYEVVNCSRGLKETSSEGSDVFDLVDLQQKAASEEADVQYAYDLYTAARDFDISMIDDLVCIENYETDLIFGSYRDNGRLTPSSDEAEDDEDSNDENNWRNEYPDSEPSSIDEEDMVRAVERCNVASEEDLSSDTGDERLYDPPDIFSEDVLNYGPAYAKYKAKVLEEEQNLALNTPFVHSTVVKDLDEESLEGYKEDSDDGFYYGQEQDTEHFKDQYRSDSPDEFSPD